MILLPIDIDESKNKKFLENPDCQPILEFYPLYYFKVDFKPPWIGYFVSSDGEEILGVAGFKGKPINGKVEIAYSTFAKYEGKGIGTQICKQLVLIALEADPEVRITARTLLDGFASISILKKNGFECLGIVMDEEDGEVLEWEYKGNVIS
jgi:RimJ/RimL family protein N-acetyltransferase